MRKRMVGGGSKKRKKKGQEKINPPFFTHFELPTPRLRGLFPLVIRNNILLA